MVMSDEPPNSPRECLLVDRRIGRRSRHVNRIAASIHRGDLEGVADVVAALLPVLRGASRLLYADNRVCREDDRIHRFVFNEEVGVRQSQHLRGGELQQSLAGGLLRAIRLRHGTG